MGVAAATLLVVVGWLFAVSRWETYVTAVGEQRTVQLGDGSLVQLNARSKLTVRLSDARREVRLLEGEAFFKVSRDTSRPFTVETDRAVVRVLGTQFNVDRHLRDTRVAVLEGTVWVTPTQVVQPVKRSPDSQRPAEEKELSATLSAGEQVRIASTGIVARSKANTADAFAWRERHLVFSDSTLEEIATEFNRYNRRQQLVIDDEALRDERFGGTFEADEPAALIEFLRRTPGLLVIDEGDRLVIRRR
jgi:transmembrane sensor